MNLIGRERLRMTGCGRNAESGNGGECTEHNVDTARAGMMGDEAAGAFLPDGGPDILHDRFHESLSNHYKE